MPSRAGAVSWAATSKVNPFPGRRLPSVYTRVYSQLLRTRQLAGKASCLICRIRFTVILRNGGTFCPNGWRHFCQPDRQKCPALKVFPIAEKVPGTSVPGTFCVYFQLCCYAFLGAIQPSITFTSALPRRPRSLGSRTRAMAHTPAKLYRMISAVMMPVHRP